MDLVKQTNKWAAAIIEKNIQPGDKKDAEGFWICGRCGQRKEQLLYTAQGAEVRAPKTCQCMRWYRSQADKEQERKDMEERIARAKRNGISDPSYLRWTFDKDDNRSPKITDTCKKYVADWDMMKKHNMGIVFYGGVGTGKSFLASCIGNALLNQGVPVSIINMSKIFRRLQFNDQRNDWLNTLNSYDLMVIDDLGAERDTSYSLEQVFDIIDTRYRINKPLIVTTNLSLDAMRNCDNMFYQRIYDRVLEMCPIQLKMEGKSGRSEIAEQKRQLAREILGGKK